MIITNFLLIRARTALLNGNAITAAYFCSIAASLAADHGSPDDAAKCRNAARLCQEQASAQLLSAC